MSRIVALLLLTAVFCLGAALAYFNWTSVTFDYLAGTLELPLVGLLLVVFVLGIAVSALIGAGRLFGLRRDVMRLRRQLRDTEAELKNLRNIPLKDA